MVVDNGWKMITHCLQYSKRLHVELDLKLLAKRARFLSIRYTLFIIFGANLSINSCMSLSDLPNAVSHKQKTFP